MANPFRTNGATEDRIEDASNCAAKDCTNVYGRRGRRYQIRKVCCNFEINVLVPIPAVADAPRVLYEIGRIDRFFPSYWEVWERPDGSAILALDIRKDVALIKQYVPGTRIGGLSIISDWAEKQIAEATDKAGK
jgi:hypothetical protein